MYVKKRWIAVLLLLAMAAMFAGCAPPEEPEEPVEDPNDEVVEGEMIELSLATFWPSEDFQVAEGHWAWADEIKERVEAETPHQIEFSFHPGQALLGATEIFDGVAHGAADIGTTCPSYTPGLFPVTAAFELPGLENDNALVSSMVMQEAYETYDLLQQEYEEVKVLHFWATGPGDIITTEPVRSLEDLAGMEIRVAGGSVPVVEELGATPTTMPMSDSYLNLEQGIVRGILAPTDTLKGFRLAEVTSYITKTPYLYNIVFMKIMNWDTWHALPDEVQQIIDEVSQNFVYEYGVLRTEHTEAGQEYAVQEYGHEVIELDPEEEERWLQAIEPVQENWIQGANEEGLPGEEIMDLVRELDRKYSEEYGDYFN